MELSGKVALVTGASQGLGRAYSLALAKAGATVVASARSMGDPKPGEAPDRLTLSETLRLAVEQGSPVHPAICDVGSEDQVNRTVAEAVGKFGRIDILVNNAATYPGHFSPEFGDPFAWTPEIWQRYFAINVIGPYLAIKAAAPHMKAQRSGSIINISSTASYRDDAAHDNLLGYATSKAALNRLSMFFASELAPWDVAVNAVCPGVVITGAWKSVPEDQIDAARNSGLATDASPEAVGPYILHLAKQTADSLSGQFVEARTFPRWPTGRSQVVVTHA
jgi:NAD(P)-dependent dehydrogenase (short-subunit alcohol dehydrogenase family)